MILRGVTFDHPRSIDPLRASAARYAEEHPQAPGVSWETHPLAAFEDEPIEQIAARYDLVVFDHPHLGDALEHGALMSFEQCCPAADRADLAALDRATLGLSARSYMARGAHWAVPIDGAAQCAAWRAEALVGCADDFLAALGGPDGADLKVWEAAAAALPVGSIAAPFNATHLACTLLSLAWSVGDGTSPCWPTVDEFDEACALIARLVCLVEPRCLTLDPIAVLEEMATTGRILAVPFVFGYAPYARALPHRRALTFGAPPALNGRPARPILGGAGVGISANCAQPGEAARYALWLTRPAVQADLFPRHGGQPASRAGWESTVDGAIAARFLVPVRPAMERAFVRPRHAGYPSLHQQIGALVHAAASGDAPWHGLPGHLHRTWHQARRTASALRAVGPRGYGDA